MKARCLAAALAVGAAAAAAPAHALEQPLPFGPGERVVMRITWSKLFAGRAWLTVEGTAGLEGALDLVLVAKSQGFFAWLTRFKVDDRTVSHWDAQRQCSLGIEKRLREGRHARDQRVRFDAQSGVAAVEDARLAQKHHGVGPCVQDILSAFFAARAAGFPREGAPAPVRTFDNGRLFDLRFVPLRREVLDLPAPLGKDVPTRAFDVLLVPETGVFEQQGRLQLWVTDDERRIPVRLRAKAPVGWVSADLESYVPGVISGGSLGPVARRAAMALTLPPNPPSLAPPRCARRRSLPPD
jgi:hypothetical protein